MPQLICLVWLWSLFLGMQKKRNASARIPILKRRVFHQSSFFDECLSWFAQFGFDPLVLASKKTKNASANTPILESRVFHRSSFFDECISYFAQFGFDPPGPGRQNKWNASANILILESGFFHRSSYFDECLSWFAQFGFEAFFSACNKWGMLQLISSFRKVKFFIETHFLMNALANLRILIFGLGL